ncbi:unnamed protein product [Brassica oleracea]
MDEVENGMEREIHSGDGAHNKAVAKPFGKPCSKSNKLIGIQTDN